jgi:hypothetical protein
MRAPRSVMPVALVTFLMVAIGTTARQAGQPAAPEILWQFEAGG